MKSLLTTDQLAQHLNIKESTIYNWTHIGYIPHIKLGRLVRFDMDRVAKWLRNKSVRGRTRRKIDIKRL